ncbi:arginine--tRNA ligase [Hyphomicrobiales bacterium]|jgi:arginyl-tRNA synthetase|nr:arginine--tRNA ligase [Hyphomicrobiales bacterium]|tara:strand:+ start:1500 stop:3239 length:1740 start_codon:yes stop_codon:yes gene_type:complete
MNIVNYYREAISDIILDEFSLKNDDIKNISFEFPKETGLGDFSTNAAMALAGKLKKAPNEIAESIVHFLNKNPDIENVDIAGKGFINIKIKKKVWQNLIYEIIKNKSSYGDTDLGNKEKINVEYVSANPTGPLHVGHTRGAVFGDTLSNILVKVGYDVCREYYVNDAGEQIDKLARSSFVRYQESCGIDSVSIPEGLYPGDYLISVGDQIKEIYGNELLDKEEGYWLPLVKKISIYEMLKIIKKDLKSLNIEHDVFTSEFDLLNNGFVEKIFNELNNKDLLYEGETSPPKGSDLKEWVKKKHILFKSKNFGDDEDRVVKKHDGSWTYFMPDIAYHKDKSIRGFKKMINVWGADHSGYISRVTSAVNAITDNKASLEVKVCQLVRLTRGNEVVKMSKRSGSFITLKEMVDEVGRDAVRFMMVTRKNDAPLDFDYELVKEQTKDNPIFYIQYAHARICSVIRRVKEDKLFEVNDESLLESDVNLLDKVDDIELIKIVSNFPRIIEQSAIYREPHRLAFYLKDLASSFHSYWNLGNENADFKVINKEDINVSRARLALIRSVGITIAEGLNLLGIEALEELR